MTDNRSLPEPQTHHTRLDITYREEENGLAVVVAAGRLMLGPEGAELENVIRKLVANGARRIILDFTGVTHIDSTGIGRCISSLNMIMQAGGKLVISGATGQVREGFRVTRLDRVFRFVDDMDAAHAAVA